MKMNQHLISSLSSHRFYSCNECKPEKFQFKNKANSKVNKNTLTSISSQERFVLVEDLSEA